MNTELPAFVVQQYGVVALDELGTDETMLVVPSCSGSCPPEVSYWDGAPGWEERIAELARETGA